MSDGFKKFIDTGGKTLDEIRRTIEGMLHNTLDSVVDEAVRFVPRELGQQIKQAAESARKSGDDYYKPEKYRRAVLFHADKARIIPFRAGRFGEDTVRRRGVRLSAPPTRASISPSIQAPPMSLCSTRYTKCALSRRPPRTAI